MLNDRETVMRLAGEAGIPMSQYFDDQRNLERFATFIAKHAAEQEREACAIMCEVHASAVINDGKQPAWAIAHECAAAIRTRSAP